MRKNTTLKATITDDELMEISRDWPTTCVKRRNKHHRQRKKGYKKKHTTRKQHKKTLYRRRNKLLGKKLIAENCLQLLLDCGAVSKQEIKRRLENLLDNLKYQYGIFAYFYRIEYYKESETRSAEDKHIHIVLVFPYKTPDINKNYIRERWGLGNCVFMGNLIKGYTKGFILYLTQDKEGDYKDSEYTKFDAGTKFFSISQNYEEITNSNIQEKRILVSDLSEIITIAKEGGALIRKKTHRYNGICYIDKIWLVGIGAVFKELKKFFI